MPQHAQIKPICDSFVVCRASRTAEAGRQIYVTVFQVQRARMILLAAEGLSNDPIAMRLDSRREVVGRRRKCFFADRLAGLEQQARPGRPGLFPRTSSCRLRHGLANWPRLTAFRCFDGVVMILRVRSDRPGWWLRSAEHDLAMAAPGCDSTLVSPQLDFSRGQALKDDEFVISADEKTSIQARRRKHPTHTCRPRTTMRVEHEYWRRGALACLAALDVHHARVFGRCEPRNGIAPFDRLVEQVMTRPPDQGQRRAGQLIGRQGLASRSPVVTTHVVCSGSWTTVPPIADSRPSNVCGSNTPS